MQRVNKESIFSRHGAAHGASAESGLRKKLRIVVIDIGVKLRFFVENISLCAPEWSVKRDVASYVHYRYMSFVVALATVYRTVFVFFIFFSKDCVLQFFRSLFFIQKILT